MYKRILVPMEDEEQGHLALDHACLLAQQTGGVVLLAWLVPVVASGEHFFTQIQVEPGSSGARRKERGEVFLARETDALSKAGVDLLPKVVVTPRPLEQAIVELAVEEQADLIVLSTLPRSAVGRFVFGSVGEKVRRRSPIPVLFVNAVQTGEEGN